MKRCFVLSLIILHLFPTNKANGAFEERLLSARASALGGLYAALPSDQLALFGNVANLTKHDQLKFSVIFSCPFGLKELSKYNTDSFDSRIYIYEHDFPGVLRNIAVFNEGHRFMVLASKDISTYFSASVKFERYSRSAQKESTDETRIGFQIDISI